MTISVACSSHTGVKTIRSKSDYLGLRNLKAHSSWLIDLFCIPVNKAINSRFVLTKYSDLYKIVQPSLDLISLCLLTGAKCGKDLYGLHGLLRSLPWSEVDY